MGRKEQPQGWEGQHKPQGPWPPAPAPRRLHVGACWETLPMPGVFSWDLPSISRPSACASWSQGVPAAPSAGMVGLTHEEIEDRHVDEVEEAMAAVIGRRLSHLSTVVGVQLPPAGRGWGGGHGAMRAAVGRPPPVPQLCCPMPPMPPVSPVPQLTQPSCSCGRSGAKGCARSGAWPRSCQAATRPWSPPAGPACRRGRAR